MKAIKGLTACGCILWAFGGVMLLGVLIVVGATCG